MSTPSTNDQATLYEEVLFPAFISKIAADNRVGELDDQKVAMYADMGERAAYATKRVYTELIAPDVTHKAAAEAAGFSLAPAKKPEAPAAAVDFFRIPGVKAAALRLAGFAEPAASPAPTAPATGG